MKNNTGNIWKRITAILFVAVLMMTVFVGVVIGTETSYVSSITVPPGYSVEVFVDTGLYLPTDIEFDSAGNLYVGQGGGTWNALPIIKVIPDGTPTIFSTPISDPDGVAVDSSDNVFVAGANKLTKVTPDGTTTVFRSGFSNLNDIAIDSMDNMYVLENDGRVFKVTSDGATVTPVAEGFDFCPTGATAGLSIDSDDNLYVDDPPGGQIFKVELGNGDTVTSFLTGLNQPGHIAFSPSGDVFVMLWGGEILKVSSEGEIIPFVGGLTSPHHIAFSESGELFVTEWMNNRIIKISGFLISIPATVDIDPDTLNLKSKGKWITAYIELPECYDASNIDCSTIRLEGTLPSASCDRPLESVIGDYDDDGIPDLMVKFDRQSVIDYLEDISVEDNDKVELIVTGYLMDSTPFEGRDIIRVIDQDKGKK